MKNYFLITVVFFFLASQGITQVSISLRAGSGKQIVLSRDQPLVLKVTISNQEAQADERWNMAADRKLAELALLLSQQKITNEAHAAEKKQIESARKKIRVIQIGTNNDPWTNRLRWNSLNVPAGRDISGFIKLLPNPASEGIAVLDEKGSYTAYFGIGPGDLKNFSMGTYSLSVSLDSASSNNVQLVFKADDSSNDPAGWMRFATFYWHANEAGKGLDYTDRILSLNPASVAALSLKGDLLVMIKDYPAALKNYEAALKQFYIQNPSVNEPPEYLLAVIEWVKAQTGK